MNMAKLWEVIDKITTECPLCAFGRGVAVGAVIVGLTMASCHG